jgi:hypothetical protein
MMAEWISSLYIIFLGSHFSEFMMENSRKGLGIWRYRASHLRVATYVVALATLLAAAGLWSLSAFLFNKNFHTVIPNEVYRSAQPSPAALDHWITEFGLRSVINLRGVRIESHCSRLMRGYGSSWSRSI